jgi:hypothetical protein
MLRSLAALAIAMPLLLAVQACGGVNSIVTYELGKSLAIQAVESEAETRDRSTYWPQNSAEAFVAPSWSRGGLAVRLGAAADSRRLSEPELLLRVVGLSSDQKDIRARCSIAGHELPKIGKLRWSWWRYEISPQLLALLTDQGGTLTVETIVGNWSFLMPPDYFRGFLAAWSTKPKVVTRGR